MKRILIGTTALLTLVALGAVSTQRAQAQKGKAGPASLEVKLDLNKAVAAISKTIGATKDRGAWVKALLEQTKSKTRGNYNVMVFNMQQNYEFNPPPNTFKFVQARFPGGVGGDITYGVWVFRSG